MITHNSWDVSDDEKAAIRKMGNVCRVANRSAMDNRLKKRVTGMCEWLEAYYDKYPEYFRSKDKAILSDDQ